MPKHLKNISKETLHENPWWKYNHDTYELPNGEVGHYYYGESSGTVMIIPIMPEGKIVMTLQHRYLMDRQSIEFPGGGIKEGQLPIEAAKLELYEETGCVAGEMISLGKFEPDNGLFKDTVHVFLTHVEDKKEQHLDITEEIDILERRPDEIDMMIRQGDISCGQTIASWALARNFFAAPRSQMTEPGFATIFDYFS